MSRPTIKEMIEFDNDLPVKGLEKMYQTNASKNDMVNHPPHYNQSGIECIDAIKAATGDGFEYYLLGNIIKYVWRYPYKNGVEDLKKADFYLDRLIEIKDENKG